MAQDRLDKLYRIGEALNKRFPGNDDPFRVLARLLEECGEMAEQVHIFEGTGIKREKAGAPDKAQLAKEAQDIMTAVLHLVTHYEAVAELDARIEGHYRRVVAEGLVRED